MAKIESPKLWWSLRQRDDWERKMLADVFKQAKKDIARTYGKANCGSAQTHQQG